MIKTKETKFCFRKEKKNCISFLPESSIREIRKFMILYIFLCNKVLSLFVSKTCAMVRKAPGKDSDFNANKWNVNNEVDLAFGL
jgi:hypothetical protein